MLRTFLTYFAVPVVVILLSSCKEEHRSSEEIGLEHARETRSEQHEINETNETVLAQKMATELCECLSQELSHIPNGVSEVFINMAQLPAGSDYAPVIAKMDSSIRLEFMVAMINMGNMADDPSSCIVQTDLTYQGLEHPDNEAILLEMEKITNCELARAMMKLGFDFPAE